MARVRGAMNLIVLAQQRFVAEHPDALEVAMPTITTRDGAHIFYKDWGSGQPVVFSHGWPLNADAWDEQLFLLASNGFRAIAHDRRGHGRSTQTWSGNDMDTYSDDLATLVETLSLTNVIHVGHSTGGGEVTRYIGRHGSTRVAKAVLVDAVTPGLLKTPKNPDGMPLQLFDQIRAGVLANPSQYWEELSQVFYGANRPGAKVPQGVHDAFWLLSMQCGLVAAHDCIKAFSESDFTDDCKKFDIPTLIIHGDDDQVVPISVGGDRSSKMIRGATYKVYKGGPHGLMTTHQDQFNADLLEFVRQKQSAAPGRRGTAEPSSRAASSSERL
jgi:non-heme chloroperoxidase